MNEIAEGSVWEDRRQNVLGAWITANVMNAFGGGKVTVAKLLGPNYTKGLNLDESPEAQPMSAEKRHEKFRELLAEYAGRL